MFLFYSINRKVAVFSRQSGQAMFLCGGALISRTAVITAAHCIHDENLATAILPRDLTVLLGAHNLGDPIEHGRVSSGVRKIKVHPAWLPQNSNSNNDLAILELVDEVHFNRMIRPVCLPNELDQNIVASLKLVAAGWGIQNKTISKTPRKVDFKLVDISLCSRNDDESEENVLSKSFCAKVQGQPGTCGIDNGSGIYQLIDGKHYLKGIMSFEVAQNCTKNKFINAADVAQKLDFVTRESGMKVS